MNTVLYMILLVIYLLSRPQKDGAESASVLLGKAYNCPNAPNPMPLTLDVAVVRTFRNNTQLTKVNMSIPFPVHTNTLATANVEYNAMGNSWISLLKVDDKKGLCNLFTLSGGEIWLQAQKALGMPPKVCPIPQGNYSSSNFLLYLTKLKMATIPAGNYRGTLEVREKANNRLLLCKMFDIQDRA